MTKGGNVALMDPLRHVAIHSFGTSIAASPET